MTISYKSKFGQITNQSQIFDGAKTFIEPVTTNDDLNVLGRLNSGVTTISDDTIFTITMPGVGRGMMLLFASASATASAGHAIISYRTDTYVSSISAPAGVTINPLGTSLTNGAGDGVDGNLNVGVQTNGTIILKNRTGTTRSWGWLFVGL